MAAIVCSRLVQQLLLSTLYFNYVFLFLQFDPNYEPGMQEIRTLYGITMEQKRNDAVIDENLFREENVIVKSGSVSSGGSRGTLFKFHFAD